MKENLNKFMSYLLAGKIKPNNKEGNPAVQLFREDIRKELSDILSIYPNYTVKASTGQNGQIMAEVSWLAIFDKRFIKTASGDFYYLVFLFKADGTGFYLSLIQSWTNITEIKIADETGKIIPSESIAEKSSELLASFIDPKILAKYITSKLNLNATKFPAKGYEVASIMAKYYEYEKFTEEQLTEDIKEMISVYSELVKKVDKEKYASLLKSHKNWLEQKINLDNERKELFKTKTLQYKETENNYKKVTGNTKSERKQRIISDEKLQKKLLDQRVLGERAENLVLSYYKNAMKEILSEEKYEQLKSKITYVGKNHGFGYDIKAYDLEDLSKGIETEIHIEVKATTSKKGTEPFFMSKNELLQAMKDKNIYRIVRVYDFNSDFPKFEELNLFKEFQDVDENVSIEEAVRSFLNIEPTSYVVKGWKK